MEESKVKIETEDGQTITVKGIPGDIGPQGIQGEIGPQGIQGDIGLTGDPGRDGIDGLDGKQGDNGKDGSPDTPDEIANKLNTLKEAVDVSVIKGALTNKDLTDGMAKIDGRFKLVDQRWHGAGLSKVTTDSTLTGLGTLASPLSVVPSGGLPGGSDTQVQFNDAGSFGGDSGLTYNKTTDALTIGGTVTASNLSGTNTGNQTITLTTDVTGSGTGTFATTIANDAVTNAKLANMVNATFKGRTTAGTGDPEDLTVTQTKTLLNLTGTNSGDVTIGAFGSSPTANGLSISGQVITAQPASITHPGMVSTGTQVFNGSKEFAINITVDNNVGVGTAAISNYRTVISGGTGVYTMLFNGEAVNATSSSEGVAFVLGHNDTATGPNHQLWIGNSEDIGNAGASFFRYLINPVTAVPTIDVVLGDGSNLGPLMGLAPYGTTLVGIWTQAPLYPLHVAGDINSDTGFLVGGNAGYTGTLNDSNSIAIAEVMGGIITTVYF